MEIGVIGLGGNGRAVVGQLLEKTARNLSVYDPDGRSVRRAVNVCATAAELCDRCDRIVVALDASADLTRLCNSIAPFVRPGQIFIDLTDTSPALAHAAANGMRRLGAAYIDCGVFGREGLDGPFILFAGGDSEAFAAALQRLIARFSLSAHLTKRRAMALVYLKGQSEITDMLSIFGAQSARFAMEDAYIRKELRNNANRAVNCDSANVQRAVTAASRQTEAIERVLAAKGRESLPPALRETAALRLAHPEMSLEELGRLCDPPVGKSGVNHRLRKLEIMARELDGQETAEDAGGGKADGADD